MTRPGRVSLRCIGACLATHGALAVGLGVCTSYSFSDISWHQIELLLLASIMNTSPPVAVRSIATSVSVCLSVCMSVCLSARISQKRHVPDFVKFSALTIIGEATATLIWRKVIHKGAEVK